MARIADQQPATRNQRSTAPSSVSGLSHVSARITQDHLVTEFQTRLQEILGNNYRIERELGGGGMSRVFLAEEVELARKVVVKVLPPDMASR